MSQEFITDSFLFGANADFVEELYQKYLESPDNVDVYWRNFFNSLNEPNEIIKKYFGQNSWHSKFNKVILNDQSVRQDKKTKLLDQEKTASATGINLTEIINKFRDYGHLYCKLDPLNREKTYHHEQLNFSSIIENLATNFETFEFAGVKLTNIADLFNLLNNLYCKATGYEVSHLTSDNEKKWFYQNIESAAVDFTSQQKITFLKDLIDLEGFEQFIHLRFPGTKRFSVEGGETSLLAVMVIINLAANQEKVLEILIGMPHRGRLNMLTKILGKDYAAMLSEFQGNLAFPEDLNISGDVKYHLGKSAKYVAIDGHEVHLSLTANPSHLEAVNSVVLGKVRAKQDVLNDKARDKVMCITLHGDASFCGQGVVAEALNLSNLSGYKTGGTVHIVVNNQIGFTTLPIDGRSGRYPTEFAKIIGAPIIHVNGDDVEAVVKAARLAEAYRFKFQKDVVLDVFCYRKYGHNEGDEPMFTQPEIYDLIKQKASSAEIYADLLAKLQVFSMEETKNYRKQKMAFFDQKLELAKQYKAEEEDWLKGRWNIYNRHDRISSLDPATGINKADFVKIGQALVSYPDNFKLHPKIARLLEQKKKMFNSGKDIDWATAEALAYGSLLIEGSKIRMSGQDCKRGTFSHRHAVFFDQQNEQEFIPLNNIDSSQVKLEIINSSLSEYAVLGFEYGYSLVDPKTLTIWEAQFGDFANGAQIIIDQFIASAEEKWLRMSGLVLLLPHGYEGQGPEHSSARLERFLQLCAQDNIQVVNCSSPANFFHLIRRQIHRKYRKPLIVMAPKYLLRHPLMVSKVEDFLYSSAFRPVKSDEMESNKIKRVVIASGKVYFDLLEMKIKNNIKDIALVGIDKYYPFPKLELQEELTKFAKAEIIWCQEEPKNMGAWNFIRDYLDLSITEIKHSASKVNYVGRPERASPSSGYLSKHNHEQAELLKQALNL